MKIILQINPTFLKEVSKPHVESCNSLFCKLKIDKIPYERRETRMTMTLLILNLHNFQFFTRV
jgi:hypothetical protein